MADYDIGEAFQRIEEEMIASMSRNLKRHLATEAEEGLNYAMWQAEQLAALHNFRKDNKKLFSGYFSTINGQIADVLWRANESGKMDQEAAILDAIKKGFKAGSHAGAKSVNAQFFKINDRKMKALIKATQRDMLRAEHAMLRKANDAYRKIIYNADVFYSSGAGTLAQSVDMATKDFLSGGLNCVEYKNGAIVGIDSYARMALRTTSIRAYLQGEAAMRDSWGINTVIVNRRGIACPKCLQWVARVYYDDVWSSVPVPEPAQYPLLSDAIAGGLYHPNCKDSHTTYFEGVSEPPKPLTKEEIDKANRAYKLEQRQRYNERQIRKYKRLSEGSVDPENAAKYKGKLSAWQAEQRRFVKAHSDVLTRRYELEKVFPEPPSLTGKASKVDNSGKRGIMHTKVSGTKVTNPMDPQRYQAMKKGLEKNGVTVTQATGDDLRYLLNFGGEATYSEGVIRHIGEVPSASAMFEEVIHHAQAKKYGELRDYDPIELAAREVAAQRKLLKNQKAYGFDRADTEDITRNLSYWEKRFEKEAGIPYDESTRQR